MEKRTYYMILGVSRTESPGGIRAAYRDLVRKLHPDVAGEASTPSFLDVTEAYAVLSDAERRREYNHELRRAEEEEEEQQEQATQQAHLQPAILAGSPAARPQRIVHGRVCILGHPETIRPSFEAMYDRFLRNFTGLRVPKSERLEGLNFEVLLTPSELVQGRIVPVGVPVFHRCARCGGSGRDWFYACAYCQQSGFVEGEQTIRVKVPPMTPPGTVFEIPLHGFGIHNFYLRLHVLLQRE